MFFSLQDQAVALKGPQQLVCSVEGWGDRWRLVAQRLAPPPTRSARQAVGPAFFSSIGWSLSITSLDWTIPWLLGEILWIIFTWAPADGSFHSTFPLPVSERQQIPTSGLASCHFVFTGPKNISDLRLLLFTSQKTELLCPASLLLSLF